MYIEWDREDIFDGKAATGGVATEIIFVWEGGRVGGVLLLYLCEIILVGYGFCGYIYYRMSMK